MGSLVFGGANVSRHATVRIVQLERNFFSPYGRIPEPFAGKRPEVSEPGRLNFFVPFKERSERGYPRAGRSAASSVHAKACISSNTTRTRRRCSAPSTARRSSFSPEIRPAPEPSSSPGRRDSRNAPFLRSRWCFWATGPSLSTGARGTGSFPSRIHRRIP